MKILLLVPSLNAGGVETGTIDLSTSLAKKGHDVVVVSSGGVLVAELDASTVKHIALPIHKKSLLTFLQVGALAKIIREENIDVVHAQSRVPAWVAYYACKKTAVPFVTSCHGYYSANFASKIMAAGERVIVISEVIAQHMRQAFGVPQEKIRLVYRGVDLSRYPYQSGKYEAAAKTFRIANIARLTPLKGQKEFIKAIKIVAEKIPALEVWLVGSGDKPGYEAELKALARELKLENIVKFLGRRSDIPEILKTADLLVLSTKTPEAFGRVIIEAGAVGTTVCASHIGGIAEIIEDGKDGTLFETNNAKAMAHAIIRTAQDRNLLKRYSQDLRKKVEEKFSLERMTDETLAVYREVVRKKRILVIKIGGLGDAILAVPSLRALRKKFDDSRVELLINKEHEPLFHWCPYIDRIIVWDRANAGLLQLTGHLKKERFDISVDFKNNAFTHCAAFLSGIVHRYGFAKGFWKFLLNNPVAFLKTNQEGPLAQQARILEKLDIDHLNQALELWTTPSDDSYIEAALKEKAVSGRDTLVGMVLAASAKWPTKNWPAQNFIDLAQRLTQRGLKVVLVGQEYPKDFFGKFSGSSSIIDFVGKTNLTQFVSLIKRLSILVTPDSAAMHVAAAFGIPIVALFGPTDPKKHIPPVENIDVLVKVVACQPCYKRQCSNSEQLACLKNISIDEVFKNVIQRIKA